MPLQYVIPPRLPLVVKTPLREANSAHAGVLATSRKKLRQWGHQYICVTQGRPLEGEDDSEVGMLLIRA